MTTNTRDEAAALLAWMDDAHYAVDLGHTITPTMALALTATPEYPTARPFDAVTMPRTWFLEEYERVMRAQLRDPVPFGGTDAAIDSWRQRQARHSDDLANLLHQHTRCLDLARAFVQQRPVTALMAPMANERATSKAAPRQKRRSAALSALDAIQEAA